MVQISPDPNIILKIPNLFLIIKKKKKNIIQIIKNIGKNFSVSYKEPLHILEAKDQYFYDEDGRNI